MSTQLYYTVSNPNQTLPDSAMTYATDRSAFMSGARNRAPAQQQASYSHGGINMYQQQQIQAALYQQQQLEFAQQQAQLEMHLQLEQMRLQNLALQEQIMMGQVHAHQQSQAEAQAQQLRGYHHQSQKALGAGRLNLNHSQAGTFAERALARRQQAEADALYAQYYPNEQEEDDLLQEMPVHTQRAEHADSVTPPALVFSKPDEAFPVLAPSSATSAVAMRAPNLASKGHQHTDSGSSVSTFGSLSSFTTRSPDHSESELADSGVSSGDGARSKPVKSASGASPPKKKFSDVVKSSPAPAVKPLPEVKPATPSISVNTAVAPKLNPFSSVFVPGSSSSSTSSSATEKVSMTSSPATVAEPSLSASSNNSVSSTTTVESCAAAPTAPPAVALYRAVRSKSPPGSGSRPAGVRSVSSNLPAVVMGAMPVRQPRGPAAEAELTNQNFATRIRKRAIGAIKTLGPRVPGASPSPTPTTFQFHPQLQQQMLEGLLHQQHQAGQASGFHSFLDVEQVGYPHGMVSPGLAHLMAAARAREERFGY